MKIMIVDDDTDTTKTLSKILKLKGYKTVQFYGGNGCVKKIIETNPDLILLDIMMPDISGIEVAEAIQSNKKLKAKIIIYISAVTLTKKEEKALLALPNVVDFIRKPFDIDDLLKRIEKVLKHAKTKHRQK